MLVIFLTIQNMTMLLLTKRWPIMIHQSNLRLNNPKKMNFCLCVFDPAIGLRTYAFALLTHTKDASWDFCFKHLNYFFNSRNSFKYLYWKFLRHISKLSFKTQCKRFGMKREQTKKANPFDKITFCHKIYPLNENVEMVHDQRITFVYTIQHTYILRKCC